MAEAWAVLEAAVVRVGPDMKAQNVANTIFSLRRWGCSLGLRRGRRWRLRWCG